MTALTISRVDGLLAIWPLFVAFVLLLGVAYVAARGWYAVEAWLLARRPNRYLAVVDRAHERRGSDCVVTASCEPGDHSYSWPCDHAAGTGGAA